MLVRVQGVVRRYGRGAPVLDGVDLDLPAAEVVQVVGGNGAGKSTLLRIVAGVSPPTAGKVLGRPRVVGYVPQSGGADLGLSPHAYLWHLGRVRGLSARAARERARDLLDRLGVASGRDAALDTASGGTQRKAVIAQAFLVSPELLVLDEPWDGLDTATATVLTGMLTEAAAASASVVLTDHQGEAPVPDVVVHELAGGRLTARGTGAVTILLVARPGASEAGPVWADLPGVLSTVTTGRRMRLRVSTAGCDSVLTTALAHGWSVRQVTSEAGPG